MMVVAKHVSPTLFLVAGEASGDMIASALIRGLSHAFPFLRYQGIGGPLMEKAGHFQSLVPLEALSHIGIGSIVRHLPFFLRLLYKLPSVIQTSQALALVTFDAPEFCLRLSGRVTTMPRFHCIAPAVWAWRPHRALLLPRYTDYLLSLFPFEAPYFTHMPYFFLGHPVWERPLGKVLCAYPRPLLCLLPGSRVKEITRFLPVFLETALLLKKSIPLLDIVLIAPPSLVSLVSTLAPGYPIVFEEEEKSHILASSTAALAASGTVTLELAFHQTPTVVGYQIPPVAGWIAWHLLSTPWISLINIVAQEKIVEECLQENFTPSIMADFLKQLFSSLSKREWQKAKMKKALETLRGEKPFSHQAAQVIGSILSLSREKTPYI